MCNVHSISLTLYVFVFVFDAIVVQHSALFYMSSIYVRTRELTYPI